jgi:hypothetical protein
MKIGVLGTAHSLHKAPFDDPSWEMWGTNTGQPVRWDRWFQLHSDEIIDGNPGHRDWLAAQTCPVYLQKTCESIPKALAYPLDAMKAKYGDWFFTSSIAYMMALAIEEGAEEIGLWGVDMADVTEYRWQKTGVRFFIQVARLRGIKVTVPPECEVVVPGRLYCYDETSWVETKARARYAELESRNAGNDLRRQNLILQKAALRGALDIKIEPAAIEAQIQQVDIDMQAAERDALMLDGALQDMRHVLTNWAGCDL